MLTDLADVLRAAGLAVVEFPGWQTRRQTDSGFTPRGILVHHDASDEGPTPAEPAILANLNNTGAQLWVAMDGTWHVIAAGRMWHAGKGPGWGPFPRNDGNTYAVGVETDHTTGEAWPPIQLASIVRGTAALCRHYGWDPATAVAGHKEFAPIRKVDPDGINMDEFRGWVADVLAGEVSWTDRLTFTAPGGSAHTYDAASWLMWTNHYANMIPGIATTVAANGGQLAGLVELVNQLVADEKLNLDAIERAALDGTRAALRGG
jgi:hypothetical protein